MIVCAKYQRHCAEYLRLQEIAVAEWCEADNFSDVCRAWGRLGGRICYHRHGSEHYRRMGKRSGAVRRRTSST